MTLFDSKARLLLFALPSAVRSQGYLKSPKSRNYFAHTDVPGQRDDENTPFREVSPWGLNAGGDGTARCGMVEDRNYDYPENVLGGRLPPQPQACYKSGSLVYLEAHLTANKRGHFVYKACPIDPLGVPTQECFDGNPLEFVEDVSPNAIKAPEHPDREYKGRAYIVQPAPAADFVHTFRLPQKLEGELVLLQWHYVTADPCYMDEGYVSYPFPDRWDPTNIPMCDLQNRPEQFWNCAEVRIAADCPDLDEPPAAIPPPPPPPPTSSTGAGFNYGADHGGDSRLIAYVGNWQPCPTDAQVDAYSHIVIAFAVSYTSSPGKNQCSPTCDVSAPPTCENVVRQDLIDGWRAAGKKVILGFGGSGMGGSWHDDQNNCWDYCFEKEADVADSLVRIVEDQNLDGISLDYEYCYDIEGEQRGKCAQKSALYSDVKARTFLNSMTSLLRTKLNALQRRNEYNRGRYEVAHAPMDSDLSTPDSAYFQILKDRSEDLDFLMPQFYNGETRAHVDGLEDSGAGALPAAIMFASLSNDLFDSEPWKVVFGFCISDCEGTGSNVNGYQAAEIMSGLKTIDNGEFVCNGGAFFWLAYHDEGGAWSDAVVGEVSKSAGCSGGATASSSTGTGTPGAGASENRAPALRGSPDRTTNAEPETTTDATSTSFEGTLVVDRQNRCGTEEAVARSDCAKVCDDQGDCGSGEWCWQVFDNYCGSLPERNYIGSPALDATPRCGTSELDARGLCKNTCYTDADCNTVGEKCQRVHQNYCDSSYTLND